MSKSLHIVQVKDIPQVNDIKDVPADNLMAVYKICLEMQEICKLKHGIGLSAVQVGIPWRLFLIKENEKYIFYVNCEYESAENDKITTVEGCLSLRDSEGKLLSYKVERFSKVKVTGHTLVAEDEPVLEPMERIISSTGIAGTIPLGVVFQHEIDHHNGILISEIGKQIDIWR